MDESAQPASPQAPSTPSTTSSWRRRAPWLGTGAAAALVFLFGLWTGEAGLDFGYHWDESYHARGLRNSITSLEIVPNGYIYNGMYFNFGYLQLVPIFLDHLQPILDEMQEKAQQNLPKIPSTPAVRALQQDMLAKLADPQYTLDTRWYFLLLSMTVVLWTCAAARVLQRDRPLAALGALLVVGTSWEVAYQARYIAVDMPATALLSMTLFAVALLLDGKSAFARSWSAVLCGVAAGLTAGCKLTGLAAVVLAFAAATIAGAPQQAEATDPRPRWRRRVDGALGRLGLVVTTCTSAFIAFFVSSPGVLLDPVRFLNDYAYARRFYFERPHPTYAVEDAGEHIERVFDWLVHAVPSPWAWAAVCLTLFMLPGIAVLAARRPRFVVLTLAYAFVHLVLVSQSPKLIVRNDLPLVPVLALYIGAGIDAVVVGLWRAGGSMWLPERMQQALRALAAVVAAGVGAIFIANAVFLVRAADSITDTTQASILDDVAAYMREHPRAQFYVSNELKNRMGDRIACEKPWRGATVGPRTRVVWVYGVDAKRYTYLANRRDFLLETFSSLEANYDWYPTWRGKNEAVRVDILPPDTVESLLVPLRKFPRCRAAKSPPPPRVVDAGTASDVDIDAGALVLDADGGPASDDVDTGTGADAGGRAPPDDGAP